MALVLIDGAVDRIKNSWATLNANFQYLLGLSLVGTNTQTLSVGASPYAYTAATTQEILYISGGVVTSITRHGVSITDSLPIAVILPAGETVVITYDEAPTIVRDR